MCSNTSLVILSAENIFIKAEVNGHHSVIKNKVLRVSYGSNVWLFCKGNGYFSWYYKNTKIKSLENSVMNSLGSSTDRELNVIYRIHNLGEENLGFYTCSSNSSNDGLEDTILITKGKVQMLSLKGRNWTVFQAKIKTTI